MNHLRGGVPAEWIRMRWLACVLQLSLLAAVLGWVAFWLLTDHHAMGLWASYRQTAQSLRDTLPFSGR